MAGVIYPSGLLTWIKSRPTAQFKPRKRQIQQASLEAIQEESDVNKSIRWRIISLQAMLVLILAGASGFLFYEGSFVTSMVKDELTAQQVFFPTADQIKAGGSLDPAEFPQEIRDQAGNQVTDGNQARIYAQDFLGKHLAHGKQLPDKPTDRGFGQRLSRDDQVIDADRIDLILRSGR